MSTESNKNRIGLFLDPAFIWRGLKRWSITIICLTAVVSVLTYIVMDYTLKETYTVSALVSVLPRSNTTTVYNDSQTDSAIGRSISMWQSNSLRRVIDEANPNITSNGRLSATNLNASGLIRLTATSDKAEDAYYLMNAALHNYHEVDTNFDTNYATVVITRMNPSDLQGYRSNPLKYAVFAGGAMVCFCLFLLLLWSIFTSLIHSEEQAKLLLDAPLYETIPRVKKKGKKAVLISQRDINMDYLRGMDRLAVRIAQHLRKNNGKTFLVTSIQENEGKTTIAANLALDFARRGYKTLILDFDFRKPSLHKIFDLDTENKTSLSKVFEKGGNFFDLVTKYQDIDNLDIICQYKAAKDADRFLEKVNLQKLMTALEDNYDVIILDTPPLGPVRDADVIISYVKRALLVARQDYDYASEINDAIDELEDNNGKCMGVVMNNCHSVRWKRQKVNYGYNYYGNK